ncbi:MAG: GIN domain-containing protein [Candidatus Cryptobacteroides sp.]
MGVGTKSGEAGSSEIVTKTINVKNFNTLVCSIPADVVYEYGDSNVVISASEKVMQHILVVQEEETLTMKMDVKTLKGLKDIKVYVTSRHLNAIELNGAVDFVCKNGIKARGDFSIVANGAADVEINGLKADKVNIACNGAADVDLLELKCDEITVVANGAADVCLAGRTSLADLTINGAGDMDITELQADKVLSAVHGLGSISRKKEN